MADDSINLEHVASSIRKATYHLWFATMLLDMPEHYKTINGIMGKPAIGALVVELSTMHQARLNITAVGILTAIREERIDVDWVEKYDENENHYPCPLETIHYIQCLNGEIQRWRNCQFIAVPNTLAR